MDFTKTNNFQGLVFLKKAASQLIPSYVDDSMPGEQELTKLASLAFADHLNREYPINTPKNTWLSALYLCTDGAKYASEQDMERGKGIMHEIRYAAEMHEIGDDVDRVLDFVSSQIKAKSDQIKRASAAPRAKYALELSKDGQDVGFFPINDIVEVTKSARDLASGKDKIPAPWFKEASVNIVKAHEEYPEKVRRGNPLPPDVVAAGQDTYLNPYAIKRAAEVRYGLTGDEGYLQLASFADKCAEETPSDMYKIAGIMSELDMEYGLERAYGKTLGNPYSYADTACTPDDLVKLAKENVELCDTVIPYSVFKSEAMKEGIKGILPKKQASEMLDILNDDSKSGIDFTECLEKQNTPVRRSLLELAIARG